MAACSKPKVIFIASIVVILVVTATLTGVYFKGNDEDADDDDDNSTDVSLPSLPKYPVVSTLNGQLQGIRLDGYGGRGLLYAAFSGIPYAKPPVGNLRFKAPQPFESWEGVRNATEEGNVCKQGDLYGTAGDVMGSEDCLYLNVYTPQLPSNGTNPALPVYFFIHGGGYINGSGSKDTFGPDFFMIHDIVVVTSNYRLNVFGYMSLDNDEIPGNAALKDHILALHWVQDNIAAFGGDPTKVTIGGQSAGAASTHWLTLLPQAHGLFRAAILQSGVALDSWGYYNNMVQTSFGIAKLVANNYSLEFSDAADVLMSASADDLFTAYEHAKYSTLVSLGSNFAYLMGPSPQTYNVSQSERPLITREPESYILDPAVPPVPLMLGMTNNEWLPMEMGTGALDNATIMDEKIRNIISETPTSLIPYVHTQALLNLYFENVTAEYEKVVENITNYFFRSNDSICDIPCKMKQYGDNVNENIDLARFVRIMAARPTITPMYLYKFCVKSDYNNNTWGTEEETLHSAVHSDDLHYLWKDSTEGQDYYGDGLASTTLRRLVTMYANFVKYGNPTPYTDEILETTWLPHNLTDSDFYLEINATLQMKTDDLTGKHWPFWSELYRYYRNDRSV